MNAPLRVTHSVGADEKQAAASITSTVDYAPLHNDRAVRAAYTVGGSMDPSEVLALQALDNLSAGKATAHGIEAILVRLEGHAHMMSKRRGLERFAEVEGLIAEALLRIGDLTLPADDCAECAGTGEGRHDGQRCGVCHGKAVR